MPSTGSLKTNSDEIDGVGVDKTSSPLSRTHQYRKVMKPLLERKRRARINSYLDEIKDLMVTALQAEGESITKLEKADVLELTLKHLQKLKREQMLKSNRAIDMDRFRAGYTACASEVGRVMSSVPGINITFGTKLMSYLGEQVSSFEHSQTSKLTINISHHKSHHHPQASSYAAATAIIPELSMPKQLSSPEGIPYSTTNSPLSDRGYYSGRDLSPSPSSSIIFPKPNPNMPLPKHKETVWRPF